MSDAQNLTYAVVQVFHNFGAVATVSAGFAATRIESENGRKKLAWLALTGWGAQAVSGASFGLVSYHYYQRLPDIAGIAVIALVIKMLCAATGILLTAAYIFWGGNWTQRKRSTALHSSTLVAAIALCAAAFLRWFS